jgi:Na+-driven multidrug efflux pump
MVIESTSEGVWRSGKLLVIRRGAQLPDRCIETNQPANGKRFRAVLYWHHPAVYFLIPYLLIYGIVAIAVRKKAIVYVGMSEEVLRKRRRLLAWGWGLVIAGVILLFATSSSQSVGDIVGPLFLSLLSMLGLFLILGGLIGIRRATTVNVYRIQDEYVWIRGVTNEYLALLPEWNPELASLDWNK